MGQQECYIGHSLVLQQLNNTGPILILQQWYMGHSCVKAMVYGSQLSVTAMEYRSHFSVTAMVYGLQFSVKAMVFRSQFSLTAMVYGSQFSVIALVYRFMGHS